MKLSSIKTIFLAVVFILSLSSCDAQQDAAQEDSAKKHRSGSVEPRSGSERFTRSVQDMAGRTVALPARIERIGTLGSVGVLNAFVGLMGEGGKICNQMPAGFRTGDRWKFQTEFAPQVADGPLYEGAGKELLIETILLSKPDVCFTMTLETARILERHGVPCIYLKWVDPEDIKKAVRLVGQVLNKEPTAAEYIRYFDEKTAMAVKLVEHIPQEKRPRVLYGNPVQLTQPHAIAEWWISLAGGRSVTKLYRSGEASSSYTMEDLLQWDPEVLFLGNPKTVEDLLKNDSYRNIAAVKNRVFHFVPTVAHTWGNRTVEQPLTVLWALRKLYPDLLSEERLKEEIRYFYSHFFRYQMPDEQLDAIIGDT